MGAATGSRGASRPPSPRPVTVLNSVYRRWPNGFAMRVVGVSMQPTLMDDDLVWVDPVAEPEPGSVVAVRFRVGGGRMVGKYAVDDAGAWLMKKNPADSTYPRVFLGELAKDFTVVGVVRTIISRVVDPEAV